MATLPTGRTQEVYGTFISSFRSNCVAACGRPQLSEAEWTGWLNSRRIRVYIRLRRTSGWSAFLPVRESVLGAVSMILKVVRRNFFKALSSLKVSMSSLCRSRIKNPMVFRICSISRYAGHMPAREAIFEYKKDGKIETCLEHEISGFQLEELHSVIWSRNRKTCREWSAIAPVWAYIVGEQ